MGPFKRFLAALVPALVTFVCLYFLSLIGGALIRSTPPRLALSLAGAAVVGWLFWRHAGTGRAGLFSAVAIGAALFGGLGFCLGFFGPILFARDAPQGPLAGLLITGPLGTLVGAALGWLVWRARQKRGVGRGAPPR